VQELWQRYFVRLVELARGRLRQVPRAADEEDVALSAFDSFCRNAGQGRFPQLQDRDDLWRLLATVTARKACRLLRDEGRHKRGGHALQAGANGDDPAALLEEVAGSEPSPEMALQLTEEYQRLLGLLGDEQLRQVAIWRMEGYSVEEIAMRADCAPRSVKRRLQVIRSLWEHEEPP
jgi:DNA-directed RNA polymerase specialized sigma24 family protein